ncbi:MAG: RluA family pseudouridine synthase [Candidatus Nanopelagicales bacterium]
MSDSPAIEIFEIPDSLNGERADVGVSRLSGISRNQAANLISDGAVKVSGKRVSRADKLVAGKRLTIEVLVADETLTDEPVVDVPIVFQDDDIVVVDKPVGVAAHPSPGWTGPTVTNGLRAAGVSVAETGPAEREGIVHRLDVGTSGLMVVARTPQAYTSLKAQFKDREVSKTYHTLVQGHPDPSSGTIDAPIGRHPHHDYRFAVLNEGKPSVTHYRTLEAYSYGSLLEVDLETGRTHQIRVHMSAMNHPCCGDLTYGADPTLAKRLGLTRQWLHAVALTITHPRTGEQISFESPYPPDLAHALAVLSA